MKRFWPILVHNKCAELIGSQHHKVNTSRSEYTLKLVDKQSKLLRSREKIASLRPTIFGRTEGGKMFLFVLLFVPTTAALPPSQSVSDKLLGRMLNSLFKPPSQSVSDKLYGRIPEEKLDACKEKIKASWLLRQPFTTLTNASGSGDHLDGTFYEVLDVALNWCCTVLTNSTNKTFINYRAQPTANISMLHQDILSGEADLILPIRSDRDKYKSFLPYLKILESPGIVLIQRTDSFQPWDGKNILLRNAISSCWPIVVLTLLLSFVAGIGVWAMVSDSNCNLVLRLFVPEMLLIKPEIL